MRTLYMRQCRSWGPTIRQKADSDEEMSRDESGRREPARESCGGEAGVAMGMGIDVAVYITVSEVLGIVSREAVMNGSRNRAT